MIDLITVARPYAKAAFKFAYETQNIDHWQNMLMFAAKVINNEYVKKICTGLIPSKLCSELFLSICDKQLDKHCKNLILIMVENRHLQALSYVFKQFVYLRTVSENIIEIEVISASTLSEEQMLTIKAAIERRMLCKSKIQYSVDKSILSGIIIRFGNTIIDGSVRNRLDRIKNILQFSSI